MRDFQDSDNAFRQIRQRETLVSNICFLRFACLNLAKGAKMDNNNPKLDLIGHFRVTLSLSFKASLSAKFLLW